MVVYFILLLENQTKILIKKLYFCCVHFKRKSKTLGKSLHLSPFTLLAFRINNWEVVELWQSCCGGQASAASTCCHGCCPGFQTHWTWWWGTELSIPIKISSQAPKVNETAAPRERDRKSCLNIYLTEYPQRDRERGTERETDHHTFQWKYISDFPWLLFYRHFADEASILSVALHLFLSAQMSAVMVEQNAEIQTCPKTGENGWHNMV